MGKGYRIIEPDQLYPLVRPGQYDEYIIAILHWLVQELYIELKDELEGVEIEVIKYIFRSLSAYPVLGLHYDPINREMEKKVEATIDRLLLERPISELIKFIAESGKDWKEVTQEIMK